MKYHYLNDSEISDYIQEEQRFNQYLRQRRADELGRNEPHSMIIEYDRLIFASDRRLIALYTKNRRCGNISDFIG